jgi:hypothetical protein
VVTVKVTIATLSAEAIETSASATVKATVKATATATASATTVGETGEWQCARRRALLTYINNSIAIIINITNRVHIFGNLIAAKESHSPSM